MITWSAQLGAVAHGLAQDVTRGDVSHGEVLLQALGLGALARARGTKEDEVQLGHVRDRRVLVDFRTAQEA